MVVPIDSLSCFQQVTPKTGLQATIMSRSDTMNFSIWKAWLQRAVWKRLQLFSSFKPGLGGRVFCIVL